MAPKTGPFHSFDAVAEDYDQTRVIPAAQCDLIAGVCARQAHLSEGGLFLDAGVGTGRLAAPLSRLYPGQVVGLDISPAMMARARAKAGPADLRLAGGDLQRLPFAAGTFQGILVVHILHLIERWTLVLTELQRVLRARTGVLLLGREQGGRSLLVDYYYERARARGVLAPNLGPAALVPALDYLQRPARAGGAGAHVERLAAPLSWRRSAPVGETLAALRRRTYSQMWSIPPEAHQALLAETEDYARRVFGYPGFQEPLEASFLLHAVRWP